MKAKLLIFLIIIHVIKYRAVSFFFQEVENQLQRDYEPFLAFNVHNNPSLEELVPGFNDWRVRLRYYSRIFTYGSSKYLSRNTNKLKERTIKLLWEPVEDSDHNDLNQF